MPSGSPGTDRHLPGQWALKCGALRGLLPESPGPEAVPPGTPPPHTHTMATLLLSYPHCSVWAKCMCTSRDAYGCLLGSQPDTCIIPQPPIQAACSHFHCGKIGFRASESCVLLKDTL